MAYGLSTLSSEVSGGQGGASMLDCLYCTSELTTALYHLVKLLVGVVLVYTVLLQEKREEEDRGRLVCVLAGVLSTILLC